jgi:hypothetical protein
LPDPTGTAGRRPVVGPHGGDRRPGFPGDPCEKGH